MFARRSAAEILAGHEDLRLAVEWMVPHETGDLVAVVVKAHLVEQVLAEARALDRFQELLGDDHVGIDIGLGKRRGDAGQLGELVHGGSPVRPVLRYPACVRWASRSGGVSGRGTSKVRL